MSWLSWFHPSVNPELKEQLERYEPVTPQLSTKDRRWVDAIRAKTVESNRNNITRTMAYWEYYNRNPEIHWALLAHMVSRNAGWNMTDLKGDWCSRLMKKLEGEEYFRFLERSNWLIFQDAYPQLLLYELSKQMDENLFHLLPTFHISKFMQVIWSDFWLQRDQQTITIALIINEQNYIQSRIVKNSLYAEPVFGDMKFLVEDWLDLCMILFPALVDGEPQLFGQQVESFPNLKKRIKLGKELYDLLFDRDVLPYVLEWSKRNPHTGSREVYWPGLFSSGLSENLNFPYENRIERCRVKKESPMIYSPKLMDVWADVDHQPPKREDWYETSEVVEALRPSESKVRRCEQEYCQVIQKMDLLVHAKQVVVDS
ncbi:DUF2515 family protein [Ammoniphilus sp. CFH 90114]|uniref:DUF2515 family protein n=1 Tax=Ammoniphilus sp. CFH 90114 TaxID=2493665 RepID=UPI00100F2074|nr:DUF2515 family protein [Ammoniphilus sp. CFH 90114]RXT07852.1 DUF2515 domain-containing protein [Ammoniphilus sp. CFH 90114]